MEIYLLRHGIAEDSHPKGDSARELTDEGREKVKAVLCAARNAGMEPSLILSSPYIRAIQTAKLAGEPVVIQSLVPYGTPEGVWNDLRDHEQQTAVLLAGHQPLMSQLAAWLLAAPALNIDMKKAALVRIDVEGLRGKPRGILRWMITPRLAMV